MTKISVDDYRRQVDCIYDNERYSVRDNGAVMRHLREGKRRRKDDDTWTFGMFNQQNGYLYIGQVRVHRIIATGFYGDPPAPVYVVDHIDTNRQNNRPENLRWITRLENALNNPITRKKIEYRCGSIEAFLKNPSMLNEIQGQPNFKWMRAITPEEARACLERMSIWAASNKVPSGGSLGEWVFSTYKYEHPKDDLVVEDIIESQTPMAVQINWRVPSEFSLCPNQLGSNPLSDYQDRLEKGSLFSRNKFITSHVYESGLSADKSVMSVICELGKGSVKPWAVAIVTVEDGQFCHESKGSFFSIIGATKQHCRNLGLDFDDSLGDCIDDYC